MASTTTTETLDQTVDRLRARYLESTRDVAAAAGVISRAEAIEVTPEMATRWLREYRAAHPRSQYGGDR